MAGGSLAEEGLHIMGVMKALAFGLLAVSTLFVIVDPVASLPAFLSMTANDPVERQIRTARLACGVATGILFVFAVLGTFIFQILGITMPAFQLAASVILLLVALDMLRAQRSRIQETREETDAGAAKDDIAVTPLAVPMLAGPGAISTTILLHSEAKGWIDQLLLYGAIIAVMVASYAIGELEITLSISLVAACWSCASTSSRPRVWSCSCASARRFSRSRTLESSFLGDSRGTGGLASPLDFAGFGPRRIGLPLPPYESAGDRLRRTRPRGQVGWGLRGVRLRRPTDQEGEPPPAEKQRNQALYARILYFMADRRSRFAANTYASVQRSLSPADAPLILA